MTGTWRTIMAIVIKDLLLEFRTRQVLPTMIILGMLMTWIFNLVGQTGSVQSNTLGPAALWIAFLFAGIQAQDRSFALERSQDCLGGLLLAPINPGNIYLGKLLVNVLILCLFELILAPLVIVAFQLEISGRLMELAVVLLLGNFAISGVGTLFSAMVNVSDVRGSLLSVLILIILLPMMIPAVFLLLVIFKALPPELLGTGALAVVGTYNTALSYLVVFDAVFITASWLLFSFVVQES